MNHPKKEKKAMETEAKESEQKPEIIVSGDSALIVVPCRVCGREHQLVVPAIKLRLWVDRPAYIPVQRFWPELDADRRELFFVSGVCKKCWDKMFEGIAEE